MKKQTAIEWLLNEISSTTILDKEDIKLFKQAKEIEKQQIMNANTAGVNQGLYGYRNSEEYYKKTFKK